jgi:hypothetical protein
MFNFFHTLGVGIIAAFVAFTGSFHSQSVPMAYISENKTSTTTATSVNKKLAADSIVATSSHTINIITPPTSKTASTKADSAVPFKYKPATSITPTPAENFYDATLALYKEKLSFLNNRIGLDGITQSVIKSREEQTKKDISFDENNQKTYGWSYSSNYNSLITASINFSKKEVEQTDKLYPLMDARIAELNQLKSILEDTISNIPSQNISQADYMLRSSALGELVDEADIKKTDTSIFNSLDDLFKIGNDYSDLVLKASEQVSAEAGKALEALNAQAASIRVPVIQLPTITPLQTQPTSIHCDTTYSAISGNPSTTCTDNSTLKSIHCDTTYNPSSGNPSTTCIDYSTMKSMTCDTTYSAISGNPSKDCSFR